MENVLIFRYAKVRKDEDVFIPQRRKDDADYDLFASSLIVVNPGKTTYVSTNLSIEFPPGWEGKIEEKSGLSLDGMISIHGGVIDHQFTGEIRIIVHNRGSSPFAFRKGQKVAQLKIREESPYVVFEEAKTPLRVTERGDKGFGSTGA